MSNKIYYSFEDIEKQVIQLARKVWLSKFEPELIVGLGRGGLVPAVMLSHIMKVPMETLDVSLRDGGEQTTDCYKSERACGCDGADPMRILIVDDINDTGATIRWIKQDWQASCLPDEEKWEKEVWHHNTRFACLVDNANSDAIIDYRAVDIAKTEEYDPWIVFPWEQDD